jgi:Asp-tRNA(Asn)/Glu-tRNA(Gln) amidotransferase A subunit family amidase
MPLIRSLVHLAPLAALLYCAVLSLARADSTIGESPGTGLLDASILELQSQLDAGEITSAQLVDRYLARIAAYDQKGPTLNAISVLNPMARKQAEELDRERQLKGSRGPLHGIPLLIKDNYETRGMQTAVGSAVFAGWIPPHDATIVKQLQQAGAIVIAKTNMHEFAMGFATHGSLFGQTRNPYQLEHIPGGSSGGTAAAVAANFAVAGFGSDTCGSIRMPASFNNLVGLRGTLGLTSRKGIVPLAHSWDFGGPLTHNVTDLAVIYDVIAGYDPGDPQTAASIGHVPNTYLTSLDADGLGKQRIGILSNLLVVDPGDEEVAESIRAAAKVMQDAGADIVNIDIPGLTELMQDELGGFRIILSELNADMNAYLQAHPSAPVQSVADILQSTRLVDEELRGNFQAALDFEPGPTLEYLSLQARRARAKQAVLVAMAQAGVDTLIYPTIRRKPARIGEPQLGTNCHLSGFIGFPAISMPAGFSKGGLPIGLEILAREWQEETLFRISYAYEQLTHWRRLPGSTPPVK